MKMLQLKKTYICPIILLSVYLLLGLILYMQKRQKVEMAETAGKGLLMSEDIIVKILGKDMALEKATFPIRNNSLSSEDEITFFLLRYNSDFTNSENIAYKKTLSAKDLNGLQSLEVIIPNVKLIFDRDYFLVIHPSKGNCGTVEFEAARQLYKIYENKDTPAYELVFSYKSEIFSIWKFSFLFFFPLLAIIILFNVNLFTALTLNIVISCILLYAVGLLDALYLADKLFYCYALCAFIYTIINCKYHLNDIKKNLSVWQTGAVVIILSICYLYNKSNFVFKWDEMTHWALTVKNMYIHDRMPIWDGSTITCFRYPPLYSLFQFLFLKVAGRYSVLTMYIAKQFMELSLISYSFQLPHGLLVSGKRSSWAIQALQTGTVILSVVIIPIIYMTSAYKSLYADETFGFATASMMIAFLRYKENPDNKKLLLWLGTLFVFTLIKEASVLIFASFVFAIILTEVIFYSRQKQLLKNDTILKALSLGTITFILSMLSWSLYVKIHLVGVELGMPAQGSVASSISPASLLAYFTHQADPWKYTHLLRNHIFNCFLNVYYTWLGVSLSIAGCFIVISAMYTTVNKLLKCNGGGGIIINIF